LYRILFFVVAILALVVGVLVGTLNSEVVAVDLLWVRLEWPLGLVILCAAAAGLFLGLILAWLFSILPLRARLRRERSRANGVAGGQPVATDD